jgi:hypothetical protein
MGRARSTRPPKLQVKFPNVESPEWKIKPDKNYEAEFTRNGAEITVIFGPTGKWLETESAIDSAKVPKAVNKATAQHFKGYEVVETQSVELWNMKDLVYELHLESAKEVIKVQFSGQGAVLNQFTRAKW